MNLFDFYKALYTMGSMTREQYIEKLYEVEHDLKGRLAQVQEELKTVGEDE